MQILGRGAIHVSNFVTLSQQIMPTYTCGERLQRGGLAAFFVSLYMFIFPLINTSDALSKLLNFRKLVLSY